MVFAGIVVEIRLRIGPDTWLPKLHAGRQGAYLRSLDHLGRSSVVKEIDVHLPFKHAHI